MPGRRIEGIFDAAECRRIREEVKGWTQPYVAEQVGISESMVSMLETGHRTPSWKVYNRLCALFDVDSLVKNAEPVS